MSVTTDDEDVRKTFEPQCPSNAQRIDALQEVNAAGIDSCITLCPFIWADDADEFADRLIETGIKKVIIQPFKFTGGKFVAQTREGALGLMSAKLDCRPAVVQREYMNHYRHALSIFRTQVQERRSSPWRGQGRLRAAFLAPSAHDSLSARFGNRVGRLHAPASSDPPRPALGPAALSRVSIRNSGDGTPHNTVTFAQRHIQIQRLTHLPRVSQR